MTLNIEEQEVRDKMLKMISIETDDPLAIYESSTITDSTETKKNSTVSQSTSNYFEENKEGPIVKLRPIEVNSEADKETYQEMLHRLQASKEELKKKKQVKYGEMITPEITPEIKKDLQVMSMRGFIDSKSFFKGEKHGRKLPKKFEIGTVIEGRMDTKAQRLTRKQRKSTILEELMDDEAIRHRAYQALLPKVKTAKRSHKK